ncbi:MAG: ABC transporter permease, partial [Spirochaetales bacterium]|nr:ABC transporter permease [Spirochaetales bacterium]
MFDSDTWQEIASSVKAHKLRTALTAFGVFWGIFMLVMLMGIGGGLEEGVLRNFSGSAVNSLYVWGERTSLPYRGLQPGRWVELTNEDTAALRSSFREITLLAPSVSLWGEYTVDRASSSGSFQVRGDVPDFAGISERRMTTGRFLNVRDVEEHRKVAVIGSRVREVLFEPDEQPVGAAIRINGVYFTVVGVFTVDALQGGRSDAEIIHIPLPTLQRTFHQNNRIGYYAIAIDEAHPMEEVEERIKRFLAARHTIAPEDRQAIGSWNNAREYRQLTGLFRGIRLFLLIVGVGTITAGIIGVSNVMLIVVKERTREIG